MLYKRLRPHKIEIKKILCHLWYAQCCVDSSTFKPWSQHQCMGPHLGGVHSGLFKISLFIKKNWWYYYASTLIIRKIVYWRGSRQTLMKIRGNAGHIVLFCCEFKMTCFSVLKTNTHKQRMIILDTFVWNWNFNSLKIEFLDLLIVSPIVCERNKHLIQIILYLNFIT